MDTTGSFAMSEAASSSLASQSVGQVSNAFTSVSVESIGQLTSSIMPVDAPSPPPPIISTAPLLAPIAAGTGAENLNTGSDSPGGSQAAVGIIIGCAAILIMAGCCGAGYWHRDRSKKDDLSLVQRIELFFRPPPSEPHSGRSAQLRQHPRANLPRFTNMVHPCVRCSV